MAKKFRVRVLPEAESHESHKCGEGWGEFEENPKHKVIRIILDNGSRKICHYALMFDHYEVDLVAYADAFAEKFPTGDDKTNSTRGA